jgi:hypothetical protein
MRNLRTLTTAVLGSIGMCLLATGCAAERNQDVPSSAKIVAQGEKELAYRAPNYGTVYVFDKSGQNVLYSGKVDRDDLVKVEAMRDKITVNDRVVMDKQIRDHDAINIFFEPDYSRQPVMEARPADATIIHERQYRSDVSRSPDGSITIRPDQDKVTVQGSSDAKVTVEQPNNDSKVTIERGGSQ